MDAEAVCLLVKYAASFLYRKEIYEMALTNSVICGIIISICDYIY